MRRRRGSTGKAEKARRNEMITDKEIERINELYQKSKTDEGLTPEEAEEQKRLRRLYIDSFKENLRSQLDSITVIDDNYEGPENKTVKIM